MKVLLLRRGNQCCLNHRLAKVSIESTKCQLGQVYRILKDCCILWRYLWWIHWRLCSLWNTHCRFISSSRVTWVKNTGIRRIPKCHFKRCSDGEIWKKARKRMKSCKGINISLIQGIMSTLLEYHFIYI